MIYFSSIWTNLVRILSRQLLWMFKSHSCYSTKHVSRSAICWNNIIIMNECFVKRLFEKCGRFFQLLCLEFPRYCGQWMCYNGVFTLDRLIIGIAGDDMLLHEYTYRLQKSLNEIIIAISIYRYIDVCVYLSVFYLISLKNLWQKV